MITGAVLAGGTSSRFGSEKAVAPFRSASMIMHVLRVLSETTDETLVAVAPGKGTHYRNLLDDEVFVVEDDEYGIGPIKGLVTALGAARGDYVLISPCDTPLLRREVCEITISRAKGFDGAVPVVRGFLEPLHACYSRSKCLNAFIKSLEEGMRRPKDAYHLLNLATVEEADLRRVDPHLTSFLNVNSEEDLASALKQAEKQ
ncbi:MAG: molybdenum cofactor guanylyltransferase [Thermoplasmata archaeon]|nr:molybdenum cofactor guanylyltransferase [Thermoplasmata archaeon]